MLFTSRRKTPAEFNAANIIGNGLRLFEFGRRRYFLLDLWCALPFDRLVLPALVELRPPPKRRPCAPGEIDLLVVGCRPKRRGPLFVVGAVARHVREWAPRTLQLAKRRGRLRQVLVAAPSIVAHVVRGLRLLRASRLKLVKWRTLAVLGRRYRKNAKAYFQKLPTPWRSPRRRGSGDAADRHFPDDAGRERRGSSSASRKPALARSESSPD